VKQTKIVGNIGRTFQHSVYKLLPFNALSRARALQSTALAEKYSGISK